MIVKRLLLRLLFVLLLFVGANWFYARFMWPEEMEKHAPLAARVIQTADSADVIYFGESSNTSFNPFTDTLTYSISEFLQQFLPRQRVRDITHSAYHPGMFLALMELIPESSPVKTVVVTMNIRNCGPAAIHTTLEPYMQKQKVYYSNRMPLLSRIYLSMKYYDNRDSMERERLKLEAWRTWSIRYPGAKYSHQTARDWFDASKFPGEESGDQRRKRILADDYIKAFAFVLNEGNPRIAQFDAMVKLARERGWKLVFNIVPENMEYARLLLGEDLVLLIRYNRDFLMKRYQTNGVLVTDNLELARGQEFTDQFWTTEHFNGRVRRACARNLAAALSGNEPPDAEPILRQNNWPNPEVLQPMADTLFGLVPKKPN
jgi:hypothetical protein